MNLTRPVALAATAALLSLAACGSSGGGFTPASSSQLKTTLLKSGDLPSEWVAKPHNSADDSTTKQDKNTNVELATCLGIPKSAINDNADDEKNTLHSPDFTKGESTISSDAEPDSGDGGFADSLAQSVLTSDKANSCFQTVLRKTVSTGLPSGASIDALDVKVSKPTSDDPDNVKFRFNATIKISVAGQSAAVYLTEVQIAGNGASDTVEFEGLAAAVPDDVQAAAIKAVSERVDKL